MAPAAAARGPATAPSTTSSTSPTTSCSSTDSPCTPSTSTRVRGRTVVVRPAERGERFTSLDGQEHALRPPMLMIADAERAIGLAGVMGGKNSEMTNATADVLIESATFNAINTRRTANALKLRTEASLRFERGLNPELAERARPARHPPDRRDGRRCGRQGRLRRLPPQEPAPPASRSPSAASNACSAQPSPGTRPLEVLRSLGFSVEHADGGAATVAPPYWRTDVSIEEDVVEEIARTIGYDAVPQRAPCRQDARGYPPAPARSPGARPGSARRRRAAGDHLTDPRRRRTRPPHAMAPWTNPCGSPIP